LKQFGQQRLRGVQRVTRSDRSGCGLKLRRQARAGLIERHPLRSERVWIETLLCTPIGQRIMVTRSDRSGCGLKRAPPLLPRHARPCHPLRSERVWIETLICRSLDMPQHVTRSDRSGCGLKLASNCSSGITTPVTRSDRSGCGLKPIRIASTHSNSGHPLRSERVWIETRPSMVLVLDRASPAPIGAGVD